MANYHKRNSIRAVQWDPENAQSFEDIKKLIAENPGIGWKADNIVLDALPPLTEWDSRSLQQKMVGGFSSQSR